ncbi:hypothetical protein EVAR_13559_1 [Eumeta japonica]|uniref:Uncharacterized protein n=1 Tax=Eumeta variegata TaxID=151549 RepID=A0A4C1U903_EUMVA|nr:hypothetical protein EVAR_13559_1 [Eumeta japonica]
MPLSRSCYLPTALASRVPARPVGSGSRFLSLKRQTSKALRFATSLFDDRRPSACLIPAEFNFSPRSKPLAGPRSESRAELGSGSL